MGEGNWKPICSKACGNQAGSSFIRPTSICAPRLAKISRASRHIFFASSLLFRLKKIDFISWDPAVINVYDSLDTGFSIPVATYEYQCVTTFTGPNSTATTFDDGVVSCVQTYPTK